MPPKTPSADSCIFTNLDVGDVITIPGMKGNLLVLSNRPNGGKQLGIICGCGKHVNGLPKPLYWDEKHGQPSTASGIPLDVWGDKILIDKGAKKVLAEEFAYLPCEDGLEVTGRIFLCA